ncbi:MAG: carboxymuconolactone decarboxylase family protein, partial [Planctomycetota bacterium]
MPIAEVTVAAVHPNEPHARIAPLPMESMRPEWLATLARIPGAGLKGAGFPRNVLGTIMHNPDTFGPFLEFWVTCKSRMSLSVREQELVILRMARLYGSDYVWKHHVPVGHEFGVTDAELDAVEEGRFDAFLPRERALLALTDELVEARTIRAAAWAAHAPELGRRELVDLVSLVAQYVFFALMN